MSSLDTSIEERITDVQQFDRKRCIAELLRIRRPRLDFTSEFLNGLDLEHLRHVLVAAFIQAHKSHAK